MDDKHFQLAHNVQDEIGRQQGPRACAGCTACCQGWLEIEHPLAKASLGHPCVSCSDQGCTIYASRPQDPCQEFSCAWAQHPQDIPIWMRPDLFGVILSMDRLRWNSARVLVGVACMQQVPSESLRALKQFAQLKGHTLVVLEFESENKTFTGKKRLNIQGPQEFAQEMSERFNRGEQMW